MQELGQYGVQVIAGPNLHVVNALPGAAAAHLDEVFLKRLEVAVT